MICSGTLLSVVLQIVFPVVLRVVCAFVRLLPNLTKSTQALDLSDNSLQALYGSAVHFQLVRNFQRSGALSRSCLGGDRRCAAHPKEMFCLHFQGTAGFIMGNTEILEV